MKRAEEKWRADAFECQRRASVCLHTPFGLVKTLRGQKTRNSDWRQKYVHQLWLQGRYQTSSNKLDLFAVWQRRVLPWQAITQSCLKYRMSPARNALNGTLWVVWNVQSKTRATVQDSCFWLQLMKWHDNVSTKQQIGWFHFEWQQHLRCTSCSNEAASFSFWFWRVNES